MSTIKFIHSLLTKKELFFAIFILFTIIGMSLLELIGIGGFFPFLSVLSSSKTIESNQYVAYLYDLLNPNSTKDFLFIFGCILLAVVILKNVYMAGLIYLRELFTTYTQLLKKDVVKFGIVTKLKQHE